MIYVLSQDGKNLYECKGIHKNILKYSNKTRVDYKIEVTHGYGEEQYYTEMAKYDSEGKLNKVFRDVLQTISNSARNILIELPRNEDVIIEEGDVK